MKAIKSLPPDIQKKILIGSIIISVGTILTVLTDVHQLLTPSVIGAIASAIGSALVNYYLGRVELPSSKNGNTVITEVDDASS